MVIHHVCFKKESMKKALHSLLLLATFLMIFSDALAGRNKNVAGNARRRRAAIQRDLKKELANKALAKDQGFTSWEWATFIGGGALCGAVLFNEFIKDGYFIVFREDGSSDFDIQKTGTAVFMSAYFSLMVTSASAWSWAQLKDLYFHKNNHRQIVNT